MRLSIDIQDLRGVCRKSRDLNNGVKKVPKSHLNLLTQVFKSHFLLKSKSSQMTKRLKKISWKLLLWIKRIDTAKWIWDRSIFSIIKPSFDIILFPGLWRFAQIWAQICFCFDIQNSLMYTRISFLQIRVNLQKYWNHECHVNWWLYYRIYGSVSYSFSCTILHGL